MENIRTFILMPISTYTSIHTSIHIDLPAAVRLQPHRHCTASAQRRLLQYVSSSMAAPALKTAPADATEQADAAAPTPLTDRHSRGDARGRGDQNWQHACISTSGIHASIAQWKLVFIYLDLYPYARVCLYILRAYMHLWNIVYYLNLWKAYMHL